MKWLVLLADEVELPGLAQTQMRVVDDTEGDPGDLVAKAADEMVQRRGTPTDASNSEVVLAVPLQTVMRFEVGRQVGWKVTGYGETTVG